MKIRQMTDAQLKATTRRDFSEQANLRAVSAAVELATRWVQSLTSEDWSYSRYFKRHGRIEKGQWQFQWLEYHRAGWAEFSDINEAIEFLASMKIMERMSERLEKTQRSLQHTH